VVPIMPTGSTLQDLNLPASKVIMKKIYGQVMKSGEMMLPLSTPAMMAGFWLVAPAIHGLANVMVLCSMETPAESTTVGVIITQLDMLTAFICQMLGLKQE